MLTFSKIETKTTTKAAAINVSDIKRVHLKIPALQARLKIGKHHDDYEKEAD